MKTVSDIQYPAVNLALRYFIQSEHIFLLLNGEVSVD